MACRNKKRAETAKASLEKEFPKAKGKLHFI